MEKKIKQTYYQNIEKTETIEQNDVLEDIVATWQILLKNDDVNTFEWVIKCLIDICEHTPEQAEQCAWFVHFKGKYIVKNGAKSALKPLCEALQERGLNAVLISIN